MEVKVSKMHLYVNMVTASSLKLGSNSDISTEEWIQCIASLSENGKISFFHDVNGIKGCLLFKPILLSPEWSILTDEFIADKTIIPSPPTLSKNIYQVCLKEGTGFIFWFSFKSRYDRDIWCEAVMKFTSTSLSLTPPSTPYSEYDNWPGFPKIHGVDISSYCTFFSPISVQPKNVHVGVEASPVRHDRAQSVGSKNCASKYICCCTKNTRESISEEDLKARAESSHSFCSDGQNEGCDGCCGHCCNLFCLSIMPGCSLLC